MLKKINAGHYLMVLGLAVFGLYAFLIMPQAGNAVTTMAVGQFEVAFVAFGAQPDYESITLGYSGAGQIDLEGWTIDIGDTPLTTITGVVLHDGERVQFCSDSNSDVNCQALWSGAVMPDADGMLTVRDATGGVVYSKTYTTIGNSEIIRDTVDWQQAVYATRDQVTLCHTTDGVSYKKSKDQAVKITTIKGHSADPQDIIPPFYYRFDAGFGYYTGLNWKTGAAKFAAGCQ